MKKIIFFSFLLSIIAICISCTDTTTSSNSGYGLPNEFPLQEGNAWIYERAYYENGLRNSTELDTLYIAGRFEDYYLYSWRPEVYFSLVKNYDNKLVNLGSIHIHDTGIDTTFYDLPNIWAFYGETGYIDSTYFTNYSNTFVDSEFISILPDEEYFDEQYDTYKYDILHNDIFNSREHQYVNKLGFVYWEFFDEYNNLISSIKMIDILEDFYPEELLTNNNREKRKYFNRKQTYSQDGLLSKE